MLGLYLLGITMVITLEGYSISFLHVKNCIMSLMISVPVEWFEGILILLRQMVILICGLISSPNTFQCTKLVERPPRILSDSIGRDLVLSTERYIFEEMVNIIKVDSKILFISELMSVR